MSPRLSRVPALLGRPRRRRSAVDFSVPPLPATEQLGSPDTEYELLSEFAGCHVDPDDGAALFGIAWGIIHRLAKCPDPEAIQARRDFERGILFAAEDGKTYRLRALLAGVIAALREGFPSRAEKTRRRARAQRLRRTPLSQELRN